MVKTRRMLATLMGLTASPVLLAGVVPGVAAVDEEPGRLRFDSSDGPFVIFAPSPPLPEAIADYPLPDGAEDFKDLQPGRYVLVVDYEGDLDHWPAHTFSAFEVE